MYLKRLQLTNYGPIRDLDIRFPFEGSRPKPVLLVGQNGSGKTIALSHIVNAMVMAKDAVYPESGELDTGKVFKLRSRSYISSDSEYYYAQCDFESDRLTKELFLAKPVGEYVEAPMGKDSPAFGAFQAMLGNDGDPFDYFGTNFHQEPSSKSAPALVKQMVSKNCLLYFPSNRMEEPAWLNQGNLRTKPQYTEGFYKKGETRRRVIAHSPLRDVRDWLYDIAYDRTVFSTPVKESGNTQPGTVDRSSFMRHRDDAANAYELALKILRAIMPELAKKKNLRFGIRERHNRKIFLDSEQGMVVPNLFQLSSGEMALLALFLSILRDFDWREDRDAPFTSAQDVRGLVVIDEVDLHLHSQHQHEILPNLVHMFPNVQFVMTTHSPLFVLGMANKFGNDGFEVYDLPTGSHIDPENFDEFGRAFQAFEKTTTFTRKIQKLESQRPILIVEGKTDQDYLQRAAELLGKSDILGRFEVQAAEGNSILTRIWKNRPILQESVKKTIVLLYDPEHTDINYEKKCEMHRMYRMRMPLCGEHPIKKGVENLFDRATLERVQKEGAQQEKPQFFFNIVEAHNKTERGEKVRVPKSWSVNANEKTRLCEWLIDEKKAEGKTISTAKDFRHFAAVFNMLEKIVPTVEPC